MIHASAPPTPPGPPRVLREMFVLLPPPNSGFPPERRAEWLRAFALTAGFCYGFSGDEIEIVVEDREVQVRLKPAAAVEIDADWSE